MNWAALLVCGLVVGVCHGSPGDDGVQFQACVARCVRRNEHPPDTWLALLGWNLADNCQYYCMRDQVGPIQAGRGPGGKIVQYYGKWPVYRVLGIQEPASMVASLANLLSHCIGFHHLWQVLCHHPHYYLYPHFILYFLLAVSTWIASIIYHVRDTRFTTMLDYALATAFQLFSVYMSVVRIFRVKHRMARMVLSAPCVMVLDATVRYMRKTEHFHVRVQQLNVTLFGGFGAVWAGWLALNPEKPYARHIVAAILSLAAVSLLCLACDGPPIWLVFDAHSVWHIGTVVVHPLFYRFFRADTQAEAGPK